MTHFQPCRSESNTLKRVKQWISHIHQEEKLMPLQHDNARPHAGAETERIRLHVVPCPPYSPQWALPDFWLFAALMKCLKGVNFTCNKEVQADMVKWFWAQHDEFYSNGFECSALYQHCIKWVGDYMEKGGTETKYAFWAILCFDSFQDLVKIQTLMHYFLNTLHKMSDLLDKMSSIP